VAVVLAVVMVMLRYLVQCPLSAAALAVALLKMVAVVAELHTIAALAAKVYIQVLHM
jgi:hypothetical protein